MLAAKNATGALAQVKYLLSRLAQPSRQRKLFIERLCEPLHLNILSVFVLIFGSLRAKFDYDLITRQQFAFPLLYAADLAKQNGVSKLIAMEFGVASGAGLLNMCRIAELVRKITGVDFEVVGFDTGTGMPEPVDYRDLPEMWSAGDFPMNEAALRRKLPANAQLITGDLNITIPEFLSSIPKDTQIGFVSIDVDYYSSTVDALKVFLGHPEIYLPRVPVYLDDIIVDPVSPWSGECLAVNEFNVRSAMRKLAPFPFLRAKRIFQRPRWIDQTYFCHVHDHPLRSPQRTRSAEVRKISNPFLD